MQTHRDPRRCPARRALLGAACAAALLAGLTPALPAARGELRVVTTIPDLADIARQIGGERVDVRSQSRGTENLHSVPVKPSMLVALSRADLFLEMGLSLEAAWLPELLRAARNDAIAVGAPGFVNCGEGWSAIDVPESLSREQGDIHPQGNPHFNLDPRAGRHLAARVLAGLLAVDPDGREVYERNHAAYLERLAQAEARWKAMGAKWKGRKIAVYHVEYEYLARYHGVDTAVSIEPRPGIPPTPGDVARSIRQIREQGVALIVTASWSNDRQVRSISEKTGVPVLELPNQVGGADWAGGWIELMDGVHERLAAAFGADAEDR